MHYARYELDQYRCHKMFWVRRIFCRLHLRHCRRCRKRLARLAMDDILIADLRKLMQEMNIPDNPGEYHALCDLFQEDSDRRRSTV